MSELTELRNDIAASLYYIPCKEKELFSREFLKSKSIYGLQLIIRRLENLNAIYYKKEVIHVNKKWAKKNLKEYNIDFRTDKEKYIDGLSDFARSVYGL